MNVWCHMDGKNHSRLYLYIEILGHHVISYFFQKISLSIFTECFSIFHLFISQKKATRTIDWNHQLKCSSIWEIRKVFYQVFTAELRSQQLADLAFYCQPLISVEMIDNVFFVRLKK